MVKIRSILVLFALLMATASAAQSQGVFDKEIGTDVEALVAKVDFDMSGWGKVKGSPSGKGQIPYLPALGHPPKRVALVSFYAYDPGDTKGFGSPYFGGRTEVTRQLTPDGASVVATLLHDQGIGALKEAFKAHGMDLLTPDQFIDTDAKRAFFDSFEFKVGGGTAFIRALEGSGKENKLSKADRLSAVAPGYRLFRLVYGENVRPMKSVDKKISVGLGYELTKGLGVDAVLVICNYCKATKKTGNLEGVYFYLFGPNAVPGEDSFTYWPGHLYVGLRLDGLDIPMLGFGKGDVVSKSFDPGVFGGFSSSSLKEAGIVSVDINGYERILAALGKRAGMFLQERTAPSKE
jgi:hypothetical protein